MSKFIKNSFLIISIALFFVIISGLFQLKINNVNAKLQNINYEKNKNEELKILEKISKRAKDGKVLDCDFKAKETNFSDVEKFLGKSKDINYIKEAKGIYAAYEEKNLAFGFNKGEQIFEVRSFNENLKSINLNDIKKYFGNPEYDIISDIDEKIIGYKISEDFKILFVFNKPTSKCSNPILKHYSILYPKGTVNLMSGDLGREW